MDGRRRTRRDYSTILAFKTAFCRTTCCRGSRCSSAWRSVSNEETRGFAKALVEAGADRILGFTMIGAEAGEVMTVVQTAMLADLPYPKLRDAVIAHPTMAEGLGALFSNVPAR